MFLEEPLVLPLEIVLEHDAPDFRALLAKTFLGAQVGAIERGVVRQLARPADPGVELLMTLVVAVAPMALEQAASAFRKRHDSLAPVERDAPHQTLDLAGVDGTRRRADRGGRFQRPPERPRPSPACGCLRR